MAVVVTGARDWPLDRDQQCIRDALLSIEANHGAKPILHHGGCRGADLETARIARSLGWQTQEHPADWEKHGRAAGPIRNRGLVCGTKDAIAFLVVHPLASDLDRLAGTRGSGTASCLKYMRQFSKVPVRAVSRCADP